MKTREDIALQLTLKTLEIQNDFRAVKLNSETLLFESQNVSDLFNSIFNGLIENDVSQSD